MEISDKQKGLTRLVCISFATFDGFTLSCGGKQWQIIKKDRRKGKKSGKETCTTVPPWTAEATKEEEESQTNKTRNDQPKSTTSHQEQNQQSMWQQKINQAWTCQKNYKRKNWNCNIKTNTTKAATNHLTSWYIRYKNLNKQDIWSKRVNTQKILTTTKTQNQIHRHKKSNSPFQCRGPCQNT